MNPYDSDDDDEHQQPPGVPTDEVPYDPERAQRIQRMLVANSMNSAYQDPQVTDFVLRMQEKNQKMVEKAEQQHHVVSSEGKEEEEEELDASFQGNTFQRRRQKSPDEYPPGEAYAGDEPVDELDEDHQIPSFDPKEDDVSYGRLCCVACALVLAMVATSILILVFVILADGQEDSSMTNSNTFDGMVLPFAPSNLNQLCSLDKLQTFQGVLDCREPCMKAACCWEPPEAASKKKPVCWESHPLECAPYEQCINLLKAGSDPRPYNPTTTNTNNNARPTSNIPVAPNGIKACQHLESVDEVLLCEDSCGYGECCWKPDNAQKCPTDPNCDGYKPCQVLLHQPLATTVAPAPANLNQVCADTSSQACQDACNQGTCCWKMATQSYQNKEGATVTESVLGSCQHQEQCADYAVCRTLPTATTPTGATSQIPWVAGLDTACAQNPGGTCRDTCNQAPCCWQMATTTYTNAQGKEVTEAKQGSCSHRQECKGYTPCLQLPEAEGEVNLATTAPVPQASASELVQACEQSLEGTCRDTCHQATCCWKLATTTYTGPEGNTITESVMGSCSHLDECTAYEPCKQLPEATSSHTHDGNTIPPAPSDLTQQCDVDLAGNCRDSCHQATCCWKVATTQYTGPLGASVTEHVQGSCRHLSECVGYKPCLKLPEASSDVATPPPLFIPTAPAILDQVCHPPSEGMDSIEACAKSCQLALCCWRTTTNSVTNIHGETVTESVIGSCSHRSECPPYTKACSALEDDVFSPHSPAVDATSTPAPAPTTAVPANPSTTEYTEEVIFDVCYNHEQQGNGPNLCQQVCQPGMCCYDSAAAGTCEASFDCAKYEPCQKLLEQSPNSNSELEQACANTGDLSECVRLCAQGTCCFTTDVAKECSVTAPGTVCSQYKPCETIYVAAAAANNNNNGNN